MGGFGADVIKALVPYGPVGLAIVGIVLIALRPKGLASWIIALAIFAIAAIFTINLYSGTSADAYWFDTDGKADWGGGDTAYTAGLLPKYKSAKDRSLCDSAHIGNVATCWDNRPGGRAPNVDSDVDSSETVWCAYKQNSIRVSTPPNGSAPPARIFVCSRYIPAK